MNDNGVVLVVDDHVPFARSLVRLLGASGFDAQAVHTGAAALAFIRSPVAVALILLDVSMPDMSGLDVMRALRLSGTGHPHSPPVLICSAGDDQAMRLALIELGAAGFVSKTNPAEVLGAIAAYTRPAMPPPE